MIVGQQSDPGQVRDLNEDRCLALLPPDIAPELDGLLVVADGMGGHQAGEVASGQTVEMLQQLFSSSVYRQWVDFNPEREDYYALVLKEVVEAVNERLYSLASGRRELKGMGTTVTVALLAGPRLYIGHVGDSRAYLLRNGHLRHLTKDHASPQRHNVLTRALGVGMLVRVDRSIHEVQAGDTLILCTDGLTNLVSDAEIQSGIQQSRNPQQACDRLVDLANRRGGPDNITLVVAHLTEEAVKRPAVKPPEAHPPAAADPNLETQPIPRSRLPTTRHDLAHWIGLLIFIVGFALVATVLIAGPIGSSLREGIANLPLPGPLEWIGRGNFPNPALGVSAGAGILVGGLLGAMVARLLFKND